MPSDVLAPRLRRRLPNVMTAVCFVVVALVYLVPMSLMLLNSFKTSAEARQLDFALPAEWQWENYATVLSNPAVLRGLINGTIVSVGVMAVTILVCALAGFVIARRAGRIAPTTYKYLLTGMIIPFAFVPAISLLRGLGLYDTFPGIILVNVAIQIPFTTLLFVGFISGIPRELDEAAMMDGAGPLRMFFQIIFPMLKPVIATNAILLFTYGWNEFQTVLYLLPDPMKATMPMAFFQFQGLHTYDYALVSANMVIALLPVLVVYLLAQKYIVGGLNAGSLKG